MSERDIQRRILLALAQTFHPRGIFWTADTGTARSMDGARVISFGLPGQSDIQGCLDGRWIGIEVKTAKGKQRKSQVAFQRAIEAAGGVYLIARSPEAAVEGIVSALSPDDDRKAAAR
ncbi:MAG TPA: hypothetical protein PKA33_15990 [Amaricoccus sp.]|uniref:hypothetical protein n=1 Tax=Amaricoccus sp. TaxID=1872485 RepID=UPI002CBB2271|nr:hypothetical protein [Amaricoccus sp.]HMQ92497.1 hypothetical protein [Amaricoccus sp.]HMR53854.1 hypothetical protein [Amaricoccus sp.]HMR58971.1 hypothetical protein [Amaricoccus sp.]HMU00849.1 hypothetical protein [Amaricoccus sp.]